MYRIEADADRAILFLTLEGFWTLDTVRAFVTELLPVVERLRQRCGSYATLSDSTGFGVQSAEVGEAFEKLMAVGAERSGGRTAVVVGSALNRMQAGRLFRNPRVRIFMNMDEARAWLAEPSSPGAMPTA